MCMLPVALPCHGPALMSPSMVCILVVVVHTSSSSYYNISTAHPSFTYTPPRIQSKCWQKGFQFQVCNRDPAFHPSSYNPLIYFAILQWLLEDEWMCHPVLEYSLLNENSNWALVLTLFTPIIHIHIYIIWSINWRNKSKSQATHHCSTEPAEVSPKTAATLVWTPLSPSEGSDNWMRKKTLGTLPKIMH